MKLCRFALRDGSVHAGISLTDATVLDLAAYGHPSMFELLEEVDPLRALESLAANTGVAYRLTEVTLLPPVEKQEVWAAGVTYLRSRTARTEESNHDASAYDRVYEAPRPELFFKSLPEKVVGTGGHIGIRKDSTWTVPEPELALVINSKGTIVGCTIGNDVSARDIEGENLLYLPQAKMFDASCALGPWIIPGWSEEFIRQQTIRMSITRGETTVFSGETSLNNLKRPFENLVEHLFANQTFPHGVILLTGTGLVPPDDFSLRPEDRIQIEVTKLGTLENTAKAL